MIKGVYSIRDVKVGFLAPVLEDNDVLAIRNFEHSVINTGGLLGSHPEDFFLCRLGWFDTSTGEFSRVHPDDSENVTPPGGFSICKAIDAILRNINSTQSLKEALKIG